jgi:heme oxygenase
MCWRHGNSPETVKNERSEYMLGSDVSSTNIGENKDQNFNREVYKILPGDLGTIYVIEGSTVGASF